MSVWNCVKLKLIGKLVYCRNYEKKILSLTNTRLFLECANPFRKYPTVPHCTHTYLTCTNNTQIFWCHVNRSLGKKTWHRGKMFKFCHNWCTVDTVDYFVSAEQPAQLQKTADEEFHPGEWRTEGKKRPERGGYNDCVLICPRESRFLSCVDWLDDPWPCRHTSKKATRVREEHHYITNTYNPLNAKRVSA